MLIVALTILATSSGTSPSSMPPVRAYLSALERLQSGQAPPSVERTFRAAMAVDAALLRKKGDSTLLESLSDAEYEALTKALPGIILNREEVVIAEPDPIFFQALARKYGKPADVEFFRNYLATLPNGVFKSYVEQQTDYSGCTAFGKGELVRRYAGWLAYRSSYPHAYLNQVTEQLTAIEAEVSESTCACGSRDEVLRELRQFAARFPASPVIKSVLRRIREVQKSASPIRFNCVSG